MEHSEQTVNHNTTLPRNVDKTRQKYKHESALFSAFARARRPEGRRTVRPRLVLISEAPGSIPTKTAKNRCYVFLEDIGFP